MKDPIIVDIRTGKRLLIYEREEQAIAERLYMGNWIAEDDQETIDSMEAYIFKLRNKNEQLEVEVKRLQSFLTMFPNKQ